MPTIIPRGREAVEAWRSLHPQTREAVWAAARTGAAVPDPALGAVAAGYGQTIARRLFVVLIVAPFLFLITFTVLIAWIVASRTFTGSGLLPVVFPVVIVLYLGLSIALRLYRRRFLKLFSSGVLAVEAALIDPAAPARAQAQAQWQTQWTPQYETGYTVPYQPAIPFPTQPAVTAPVAPGAEGTAPVSPAVEGAAPSMLRPPVPGGGAEAAALPATQVPVPSQPYPGQPYPGQPYPGQPYPGQAYPGQAYPGQAFPGPAFTGYQGPGFPGQPAQRQAPEHPVEVRVNRRRIVLSLGFWTLFTVCFWGRFVAAFGDSGTSYDAGGDAIFKAIFLVLACFYTALMVIVVWMNLRLLFRPVIARFTPDGWVFPAAGMHGAWPDVRQIRIRVGMVRSGWSSRGTNALTGSRIVVLMVDDPQRYIDQARGLRRYIARRSLKRYGSPISLLANARTTMGVVPMAQLIQQYTGAPLSWT